MVDGPLEPQAWASLEPPADRRTAWGSPAPAVPVQTIVLIVVGGLVLANIVAALPGRIAARTPIALLLRAE